MKTQYDQDELDRMETIPIIINGESFILTPETQDLFYQKEISGWDGL